MGGRENRPLSEVICTTSATEAGSDIFTASAQGTEFTLVTIDFAKSSEDPPYFQIKLSRAMISSVSISGGERSMTSFTFNYVSAEYAHNTPAEEKSATLMQFDLDTAKVR